MKKILIIVLMCCVCARAWAQQEEAEFTADRPGASTGPSVVRHHVVQLEQGIQYDGDGSSFGTYTFSNTLLRYGLFPNMEIRLGGDAFLYPSGGMRHLIFAGFFRHQPRNKDQMLRGYGTYSSSISAG